jgi:hypothetical protein
MSYITPVRTFVLLGTVTLTYISLVYYPLCLFLNSVALRTPAKIEAPSLFEDP